MAVYVYDAIHRAIMLVDKLVEPREVRRYVIEYHRLVCG